MEQQQLQQLEGLCQEFYSSTVQERRSSAERSLYEFLQNCPVQSLVSIVSYSAMPQLVFLALSTLLKRLTQQWSDISSEEKLYTEQTLVTVLFDSPANRLQQYAVAVTAQALARMTRLGWLENDQFKSTVGKALESGKQSHYHCSLALKYFEELISDIIEPIKSRPITTHRKIALNFRDEGLFGIVSFTHMLILQYANIPKELLEQSLGVFYKCFSFDFLGIIPEEISDDPVCIQIPMAWGVVIEDRNLLDSLEALCLTTTDEMQHLVLRCLNQMGAARKSVFASADGRKDYANRFMTVVTHVCERGNLSGDSLFEYVQLTKRFFMNFQLRELSELQAFPYWLQTFCNCSLLFFSNDQALVSPFASTLALWSYMATEAHHHLQQTQSTLAVIIPRLYLNYVQTTLKFASQELLVESYPDLKDNLECAGTMNCYYYSDAMRALQVEMAKLVPQFPGKVAAGQLAWIIYLAGALIGLSEKSHKEREEQLDSKMISEVFELSRICDRLAEYNPALEMAFIFFMNNVRKAYINTAHDTLALFYEERIDDELNRNTLNESKVLEVVDCIVQKM